MGLPHGLGLLEQGSRECIPTHPSSAYPGSTAQTTKCSFLNDSLSGLTILSTQGPSRSTELAPTPQVPDAAFLPVSSLMSQGIQAQDCIALLHLSKAPLRLGMTKVRLNEFLFQTRETSGPVRRTRSHTHDDIKGENLPRGPAHAPSLRDKTAQSRDSAVSESPVNLGLLCKSG